MPPLRRTWSWPAVALEPRALLFRTERIPAVTWMPELAVALVMQRPLNVLLPDRIQVPVPLFTSSETSCEKPGELMFELMMLSPVFEPLSRMRPGRVVLVLAVMAPVKLSVAEAVVELFENVKAPLVEEGAVKATGAAMTWGLVTAAAMLMLFPPPAELRKERAFVPAGAPIT